MLMRQRCSWRSAQTAVLAATLLALLALSAAAARHAPLDTADVERDRTVQIQVIAHSDSEADQALKLRVRDAVIAAIGHRLDGMEAAAGYAVLADNLGALQHAASTAIAEAGFAYDVTVELGSFTHDGRQYGPVVAAAGQHDLLRVAIGDAAGANWWCVLLPPVCFARTDGGLTVLSEEEVAAVFELDEHGKWVLRPEAERSLATAPPRLRLAVLEWLRKLEGGQYLARWPRWLARPWPGTVVAFPS